MSFIATLNYTYLKFPQLWPALQVAVNVLFDLPPPQDPTLARQLGDPGIRNVLGQFQSNELKENFGGQPFPKGRQISR